MDQAVFPICNQNAERSRQEAVRGHPSQPTAIVVQPRTDKLSPGTYRSTITLQFDDGRVRTVNATVVVTAGGASSSKNDRSARAAGNDFSVPGGWPVALQAQVQDDCGTALESGSVVAEFFNGDPPVSLVSLKGGRWDGTWQNKRLLAAVTVTVKAATADRQITGINQTSGGFGADRQQPLISESGVMDAATGAAFRPLSPGRLVTTSGDRLSKARLPGVPPGTSLANTSVLIAGQLLRLASLTPAQRPRLRHIHSMSWSPLFDTGAAARQNDFLLAYSRKSIRLIGFVKPRALGFWRNLAGSVALGRPLARRRSSSVLRLRVNFDPRPARNECPS